MTEQLRHRADTIKAVIRQQPERGIDLLLDFARLYGIDENIEDEILLTQYELNTLDTEGGHSTDDLTQKLEGFANAIVDNYDADKVQWRINKEKEIVEAIKQRRIADKIVLKAENLVKKYRRSRFELHTETLELRLGEITGLVGENATGKTTLLKILAGELAPDKGVVNYPLFDPKGRKDWTDLKLRMAYVPQELPVWEGTLLENLAFEAARHGIKGEDNKKAVEYIIQRLGLAWHTDKTWAELSGGYKLRFALAKALVWSPQLLILDEPLAYLDIKTQHIVLSDLRHLAKSLKKPIAILLSSQHLIETESVADQMWFMREGKLENLGSAKDFNHSRDYNLFELSCQLPFNEFQKRMSDTPLVLKTEQDDHIFFVKTPLSMSSNDLIDYCQAQGVTLRYFRDISQSVKTKFYDNAL